MSPSAALMVVGTLVVRPRISRIANIALSIVYAVRIIGPARSATGNYYYLLGSVLEDALLAAVAYYAWTWPQVAASRSANRPETSAEHLQHTTA